MAVGPFSKKLIRSSLARHEIVGLEPIIVRLGEVNPQRGEMGQSGLKVRHRRPVGRINQMTGAITVGGAEFGNGHGYARAFVGLLGLES